MTLRTRTRMRPQRFQQRGDIEFCHARPRLQMLVAFFTCLACFALPPSLLADTHYVSKSGLNTYPYDTWATAADTVARAVEAAAEWDTILIAAGHYVSDTIMMKRGQMLKGAGIDSTILDTLPPSVQYAIYAADSCIVSDFTMRDLTGFLSRAAQVSAASRRQLIPNGGIRVIGDKALLVTRVRFDSLNSGVGASFTNQSQTGRRVIIDECEFNRFSQAIQGLFALLEIRACTFRWDRTANLGVIQADHSELTVENCKFWGYDPLTDVDGTDAINTFKTDPIVIRNNLFYSAMRGFALFLNVQDGLTDSMTLGIVENNTFVRNLNQMGADRPGFVFRNNISVWDRSGTATGPFYAGNVVGEYNITWDNSPWDSGVIQPQDTIPNDIPGNHDNRNTLPMFEDTLAFLLQAFSPAIDAGDPSILDPDGSRSDIGYTGGPGGFSYPYLDLAPAVPGGLEGTASDSQIVLAWRGNHEADFGHYELFRDSLPISVADSALLLATMSADSDHVDGGVVSGKAYYYRLRAVDKQGNASGLSNEVQFITAGIGEDRDPILPEAFTFRQNFPNPFNASTRLILTVHSPGYLRIAVYNVAGRTVEFLYGASPPPGELIVDWIPSNLGSGVYFLRIEAASKTAVLKVLYLK